MRLNLPKWPNAGERVRLHFRRIPEQSCVIVAYAPGPAGGKPIPVARARLYGRGAGSNATEHMVVPLHFDANPSEVADLEAPPRLELHTEDPEGHSVELADLELLEVTVGR